MLEETFRRALALNGPVIVHVRTQKGKGYKPAEADQISFHGAALPPMTVPAADAHDRLAGVESVATPPTPPSISVLADRRSPAHNAEGRAEPSPAQAGEAKKTPNYTAFFAKELVELGAEDRRIVAITAGMPTGTGLNKFQAAYPDRFIDVGIAEQHAVTLATGLALAGMRPVVALYSTFLQRAFDQTVHDVCQNDAPVLLAVDRAGLVGEDGTSHQGMFTIPAQRQLPNLIVASPRDEQELRSLLRTALAQDHPFALHYPRDAGLRRPGARGDGPAGRAGRGAARGPGHPVRHVRPDHDAGARGRGRARGEGLVGGRAQRAVREAARPPADPRPGTRQAARRHVRGERRHRRLRLGGPGGVRGGAARRSGVSRRSRCGSSASRATGSSITARSPTCGA